MLPWPLEKLNKHNSTKYSKTTKNLCTIIRAHTLNCSIISLPMIISTTTNIQAHIVNESNRKWSSHKWMNQISSHVYISFFDLIDTSHSTISFADRCNTKQYQILKETKRIRKSNRSSLEQVIFSLNSTFTFTNDYPILCKILSFAFRLFPPIDVT